MTIKAALEILKEAQNYAICAYPRVYTDREYDAMSNAFKTISEIVIGRWTPPPLPWPDVESNGYGYPGSQT